MKLKENFITHESDGEQVMISTDNTFCGIARSNHTAAFIIDCLKEETTEKEIVDKMLSKFDAPREVISADVEKIIGKLRSIGAINE